MKIKLYLYMLLCITGGMTILGCDDNSNTQANYVITDVDMSVPVDESNIGIPKDPSKAIRKTTIEIPLHLDVSAIANDTTNVKVMSDRLVNFKPDVHLNYKVQHQDLFIEDSAQKKHSLIAYLVPYRYVDISNEIAFEVYFTVDNIAINTLNFNSAHTAYHLRGSYEESTNNERTSTYIWNKNKMDMNGATPPPHWVAGLLRVVIDSNNNNIISKHTPGETKYPCFKKRTEVPNPCAKYDTSHNNVLKEKFVLQPIATLGYPDFDWYDYSFEESSLASHAVTQTPLNDALKNAAITETTQKLAEQAAITGARDIGWYGLPIETRNSILRYHMTEIIFIGQDTATNSTDIKIPANGVNTAHYNVDGGSDTKTSIANNELTLQLSNATEQENPPPE
ncbi:MAG: hypothetical protein ISP86_03650 [Shewanellaceae bacterium]|nr:hypothetical protein [Shewanellaceae bacterium]